MFTYTYTYIYTCRNKERSLRGVRVSSGGVRDKSDVNGYDDDINGKNIYDRNNNGNSHNKSYNQNERNEQYGIPMVLKG
jgi:hypothetical protein